MVRFCILTIASGDTINFNVSTTGQFLGVKAGAGTKDTDLDALERITTVANPSIATKGNALYPVFGFGAISGVTNNGSESGTIVWTPTATGTYYYQCSLHGGMVGTITIQ